LFQIVLDTISIECLVAYCLLQKKSIGSLNIPVHEHQQTVKDRYAEFLLATITDPTVQSYTDSSAQNDIQYDYMVASVDAVGVSFCSESASGKAVLPSPTNLCAEMLCDQDNSDPQVT
jgi:hypothetical protein